MHKKAETYVVGLTSIKRWQSKNKKNELGKIIPLSSELSSFEFKKNHSIHSNQYRQGIFGLTDAGMLLLAKSFYSKKNFHFSKSIATLQHKALFYALLTSEKIPVLPWVLHNVKDTNHDFIFPLFAKPVKGNFSEGSKCLESYTELKSFLLAPHLEHSKQDKSFFLKFSPIPLDTYILQQYIQAPQYTADFFVENGIVHITAITESIFDKQGKSFLGFELPVKIKQQYKKKLQDYLQRIVRHLGIDGAFFNAEFFLYQNEIYIFECNSRVSAQFLSLFSYAFKTNYFEKMIQLSQGKTIGNSLNKKLHPAHIFVFRKYSDSLVVNTPSFRQIKDLIRTYNLIELHITAKKQRYLSEIKQDAYSFRYAYATFPGTFKQKKKAHTLLTAALESIMF